MLNTLEKKIVEYRDDLLNIQDLAKRNQRIKESVDLSVKLKDGIGPDWHSSAVSKEACNRTQTEHLKQIGEEMALVEGC